LFGYKLHNVPMCSFQPEGWRCRLWKHSNSVFLRSPGQSQEDSSQHSRRFLGSGRPGNQGSRWVFPVYGAERWHHKLQWVSLLSGMVWVFWIFVLAGSRLWAWSRGWVPTSSQGWVLCRYRIGPSEVENALMEHPAVVETAVISSPDPDRGEVTENSSLGVWWYRHETQGQSGVVIKNMDLWAGQSRFKSWPCCLIAMLPWGSYLASLFCFPICRMRACSEDEMFVTCLDQGPAYSMHHLRCVIMGLEGFHSVIPYLNQILLPDQEKKGGIWPSNAVLQLHGSQWD
jgi:hypothetical protein